MRGKSAGSGRPPTARIGGAVAARPGAGGRARAPGGRGVVPLVEAHARAGALARLEIAVGAQVGVGRDDDTARDPELGGEHTGRRQRGAGDQAPRLDGRAQAVLEALAQAAAALRAEVDQDVAREALPPQIGLLDRHWIGR